MAIIRLTKIFSFEMAHALWNYNGACRNIHGHSYKLYVTFIGNPIQDTNSPKNGMVMDFIDMKKIVKSIISEEFDHALVISKDALNHNSVIAEQMFEKMKITDFQPTVENLLIYLADKINSKTPADINLHSLKLQETETSYAEWFASDN